MTMEAAAVDTGTGASGAADTSGADAGAGAGADPTAVARQAERDAVDNDPATGKPRAKPKESTAEAVKALYKVRHGGAEVELPGDELAKRASDDWEHEFTGPGGKPYRMNREQLIRHAQLGIGAENKMRALSERERAFTQSIDFAKKSDADKLAFMVSHLGIEDPDMWILQQAQSLQQKRAHIQELEKAGRGQEAYELRQKIIEERLSREKHLEQARQKHEAEERQHQERTKEHHGKVQGAFEKAGVPWSRETFERAEAIHKRWAQIDVPKTYDEIAAEVAKEFRDERIKELRAFVKREGIKWFPDDLRRELRELELESAKVAKKEGAAPAKAAAEAEAQRRKATDEKPMSEREYARQQRGRS